MVQTYKQIQKQIEALQRQADSLRQQEIRGVVERIKVAIEHYGLTADQLGFGGSAQPKGKVAAPAARAAGTQAFADEHGNAWSGRGPRPRWLRDVLTAGRSIEEFRAHDGAGAKQPAKTAKVKAAGGRRQAKNQYRDDAGNTWGGMGPRPRWLREAVAAGSSLDSFLVK
jgi:DNA-binding protein H-NS